MIADSKFKNSVIQNDLIAATVQSTYGNDTKWNWTDFVALIIDKTSDIINKLQLLTVLHYIYTNNDV